MDDSHFCAKCGASISPGSAFCPKCGTKVPIDQLLADTDPMMIAPMPVTRVASAPSTGDVVAPVPPSPAMAAAPITPSATPTRGPVPLASVSAKPARPWWLFGVPIAIVVTGAILWAVLMGMPFSKKEGQLVRAAGPAGDTIGEGSGGTATVSQLGEPGGVQSTATITQGTSTIDNTATTTLIIPTQLPPQAQPAAPMSPPIFVPQPAPGSMSQAPPSPSPVQTRAPVQRTVPAALPPATRSSPVAVPPAAPTQRTVPAAPAPAGSPSRSAEISEREAVSRVKSFVVSNKSYDVPADCVEVRSLGYKNVGYTLNVVDLCGPDPRSLGHWRVDAVTREVFRQSGDGRFLRP